MERSPGTGCLAAVKAGFSTPLDHPRLRMILLRSK
jgi:hypothetical protein